MSIRKAVQITLLASVATAGAACGSSSSTGSASNTVPSQSHLESQLLTLDDMPTGWSTAPSTTTTTSPNRDNKSPFCAGNLSPDILTQNGGKSASVSFQQGGASTSLTGSYVTEILAYSNDASALLSKFDGYLTSCKSTTETTDGMTETFSATRMSFPSLGDETSAWTISAQASILSVSIPVVAVRKENYVIVIATVGSPHVDISAFETIAKTAVDKVSE